MSTNVYYANVHVQPRSQEIRPKQNVIMYSVFFTVLYINHAFYKTNSVVIYNATKNA